MSAVGGGGLVRVGVGDTLKLMTSTKELTYPVPQNQNLKS